MFTAFSTGFSGLMKVAQDTIVAPTDATVIAEAEGKTSEDGVPVKTAPEIAVSPEKASSLPDEAANETGSTATLDAVEGKEQGEHAMEAAKEWGSYLFGGVKDVTSKVTTATGALASGAQMLKKSVEQNTFLGEFNREQEKFVEDKKEMEAAQEAALPPWMGYGEDEENLREQIVALSSDERHFLRPPPGGVTYTFDYQTSYPIALATLDADPTLRDMRFKLVPKRIKEEDFWRNYFYRVSLIKQSVALHSMTGDGEAEVEDAAVSPPETEAAGVDPTGTNVADDGDEMPEWEKELQRELQEYEVVGGSEPMSDGDVHGADGESAEWQEEIQKMLEQEN